jgi:ABC-type transport system substrate-binding protein
MRMAAYEGRETAESGVISGWCGCGWSSTASTIEPQRMCILERNPLWPGKKPYFDDIHFLPVIDTNAAETAFDAGDVDFTTVPITVRNRPCQEGGRRLSFRKKEDRTYGHLGKVGLKGYEVPQINIGTISGTQQDHWLLDNRCADED